MRRVFEKFLQTRIFVAFDQIARRGKSWMWLIVIMVDLRTKSFTFFWLRKIMRPDRKGEGGPQLKFLSISY